MYPIASSLEIRLRTFWRSDCKQFGNRFELKFASKLEMILSDCKNGDPIANKLVGPLWTKILDTKIVHTSGKMFDCGGSSNSMLGGRQLSKYYF